MKNLYDVFKLKLHLLRNNLGENESCMQKFSASLSYLINIRDLELGIYLNNLGLDHKNLIYLG